MSQPTFSVIVPTHNRATQLGECLQALAAQDYPRDLWEVIVVDDGSAAPPTATVERFCAALPLTLWRLEATLWRLEAPLWRLEATLLRQAHAGPAAARNAGAARARGRVLAFTDDDCAPEPGWLSALAARLDGDLSHAVGGPSLDPCPRNPYSAASQIIEDWMFARHNATAQRASFLSSNNLALPSESFRALGGFDQSSFATAAAEDSDLCERWLQRGYRLEFVPGAAVQHRHPQTLASFWRQHVNRGRGSYWLLRAHARRGLPRRACDWGSWRRGLGALVRALARLDWSEVAPVGALLVVWRLAHTSGYLAEAWWGKNPKAQRKSETTT